MCPKEVKTSNNRSKKVVACVYKWEREGEALICEKSLQIYDDLRKKNPGTSAGSDFVFKVSREAGSGNLSKEQASTAS